MGDGPLVLACRLLDRFGVPFEGVVRVGKYLAADEERAAVIASAALLLGVAVAFWLAPVGSKHFPSTQASTWWVCSGVAAQCRTDWFWWMTGTLVAVLLWRAVSNWKRLKWDTLHLGAAALFLVAFPLLLILGVGPVGPAPPPGAPTGSPSPSTGPPTGSGSAQTQRTRGDDVDR